ncbi:MAG: CDP-2,3-bis-(O-geranylgeranyl)-sn-glycerol synthase [Candidatus Altiarchaeales archaeon]|nr:CDP-2,3-bis-(O-geranylgeranyl)-sn-glycerol synthase [Candidatus Altiarchaeales archaeon]
MQLILETLWFILPAYAANASPLYSTKIPVIKKFNQPMDFGINFAGNRLLGDGKTWAGFMVGILTSLTTAFTLNLINLLLPLNLPQHTLLLGFLLGFGAMSGDAFGSFIKRRTGFERGAPALFLDQLDFLAGALLITLPLHPLNLPQISVAVLLTPPIHGLTNRIAWLIKLKKHPW